MCAPHPTSHAAHPMQHTVHAASCAPHPMLHVPCCIHVQIRKWLGALPAQRPAHTLALCSIGIETISKCLLPCCAPLCFHSINNQMPCCMSPGVGMGGSALCAEAYTLCGTASISCAFASWESNTVQGGSRRRYKLPRS